MLDKSCFSSEARLFWMWSDEGLNDAHAVLRAGPTKGFVGNVALLSPPPLPWGVLSAHFLLLCRALRTP